MSSLRIAETVVPPSETWLMQLVMLAQPAYGECQRKYRSVHIFQAYCVIPVWYLVLSTCIAVCKNSCYFHNFFVYAMIEIRIAIPDAFSAMNGVNRVNADAITSKCMYSEPTV